MPTVPGTPPPMGSMSSMGEYDEYTEGQKPSPTQILLAAANMHNQGRLVDSGDHIGYGGAMPKSRVRGMRRRR